MPDEKIETLVIGGGQAGLVMSHRLKQRGLSHLVLERQRIAERWRSERWDGLQFQFPNWSVRLPDFPFPHSDPDAFAGTADIVKFIEAYADFVSPADPLRRRGDAAVAARRRRRLHRRDRRRHDRGGQCRRRHRSLSAHAGAGSVARASGVSGPCQPITAIPNSFRRGRCWWPAPARRARRSPRNCSAPAAASISRSEGTAACRAATAAATSSGGSPRCASITSRRRNAGPHASAPSFQAPMAATPSISATSPPTA